MGTGSREPPTASWSQSHNALVISLDRVRRLVHGAVRAPEEPCIEGASVQELGDLEQRLGRTLPAQLRDWLTICRGAAIGPGGFFGHLPDCPFLDLPSVLADYPEWRAQDWLPVAGDGCGNYYVLLPSGQVGFVDTMADPAVIQPDPYPDLLTCVAALLSADQATQP